MPPAKNNIVEFNVKISINKAKSIKLFIKKKWQEQWRDEKMLDFIILSKRKLENLENGIEKRYGGWQ